MNSFSILSSHVSPSSTASSSQSNPISALGLASPESGGKEDFSLGGSRAAFASTNLGNRGNCGGSAGGNAGMASVANETSPLLPRKDGHNGNTGNLGDAGDAGDAGTGSTRPFRWRSIPKRIAIAVWNSIRWFLQTLAAPGVYLLACFYDEQGRFSPLQPARVLVGRAPLKEDSMRSKMGMDDPTRLTGEDEKAARRLSSGSDSGFERGSGRFFSSASSVPMGGNSYAVSSESESDFAPKRSQRRHGATGSRSEDDGPDASTREIVGGDGATAAGGRRSVRIKMNDDTQRQRKHRKAQSSTSSAAGMRVAGSGSSGRRSSTVGSGGGDGITKDISAQLKSPTSPAGALTKYPRMPVPPRPLVPRRQPSYLNLEPLGKTHQKTLILDLDETLIHSMSKGGRMSTGHMVEVRLNTTFVGIGGQPSAGPHHPILYYVHKRPYCDEFLRRVSKWYNLVVFTASVQEYADPVIDWLESERKYFSQRFYRQHCTFRHGAFIKDLSAVEPDLSKVMILDNSPLSYMFHQDNAIPIQGWISDHTDNDLLHLVPLLEGLQYVSDVRALLALRGGEDGRHMA